MEEDRNQKADRTILYRTDHAIQCDSFFDEVVDVKRARRLMSSNFWVKLKRYCGQDQLVEQYSTSFFVEGCYYESFDRLHTHNNTHTHTSLGDDYYENGKAISGDVPLYG